MHLTSRTGRALRLPAVAAFSLVALSGCSLQGLSMSPAPSSTSTSSASTAAASAATTSAASAASADAKAVAAKAVDAKNAAALAASRAKGQLDNGSAAHTLDAGARKLVITYWSTQPVATWTAGSGATISLSAHLTGGTKNAVKVTRFLATIDGKTLAEDRGEFVITPPFSYSTALVTPVAPAATRLSTLSITFDLLIETAPHSGMYARQTVIDTLTVSYEPTAPTTTTKATS